MYITRYNSNVCESRERGEEWTAALFINIRTLHGEFSTQQSWSQLNRYVLSPNIKANSGGEVVTPPGAIPWPGQTRECLLAGSHAPGRLATWIQLCSSSDLWINTSIRINYHILSHNKSITSPWYDVLCIHPSSMNPWPNRTCSPDRRDTRPCVPWTYKTQDQALRSYKKQGRVSLHQITVARTTCVMYCVV